MSWMIFTPIRPKWMWRCFPVDPRLGKEYMRGAGQFVTKIKTHIFVPMHFTPEYAKANAFRDFAEAHGVRFVSLTHRGQKIEIE